MIIKLGNVSLLPWTYILYNDEWIRWAEYGSMARVTLHYDKFGARWYPVFGPGVYFLKNLFEQYGTFKDHKYKHHQAAMDEMDKFLNRMGKITIFT